MGIDISSSRGVIATVDQVVKCINSKSKKDVIMACSNFYEELIERCGEEDFIVEQFSVIKDIPFKSSIKRVREAIASTVIVEGEASKYGKCGVQEYELVTELFQNILDAADIDLPWLETVTAFGSSRYNGYSLPMGVACFVFNEDQCYFKELSDSGQKLKKMIGHCDVTEWTEYSC